MTKQTRNIDEEIQNAFDDAHSRKLGKWILNQPTSDKAPFDNYVNKLIDQKGGGSGPAPGSSSSNINIDQVNQQIKKIDGKFTVNIIDYRELSKLNTIGVGGITSAKDPRQRLLYTHGKKTLGNFKYYAGFQYGNHAGFTGIKKAQDIHLDWHWHKLPEPEPSLSRTKECVLDMQIQFEGTAPSPQTTAKEIKIKSDDITGSKKINKSEITDYGYYRLGLGATNSVDPQECSLHFQAFYTNEDSFKPQGLRRDFQFKKFNNIKLLSTFTESDSYIQGKLYDELDKKLGIVNLSDLRMHYGIIPEHPLLHQDIIAIEVPDDALVPDGIHPAPPESETIGKRLLTNTLAEIEVKDEAIHRDSQVPYFVQQVVNIPVPNEKGILKEKWCWLIVVDLDHSYKWDNLFKDTQIIYPLNKENAKKYHLPLGGQLYTLTNNRTIMTCLYNTVSEDTARGTVTFSASPFGANDVTIQKSEIVSIEQI